jgi:hypothetical protein
MITKGPKQSRSLPHHRRGANDMAFPRVDDGVHEYCGAAGSYNVAQSQHQVHVHHRIVPVFKCHGLLLRRWERCSVVSIGLPHAGPPPIHRAPGEPGCKQYLGDDTGVRPGGALQTTTAPCWRFVHPNVRFTRSSSHINSPTTATSCITRHTTWRMALYVASASMEGV